MKLYRFSPIKNEKDLLKTITYIAKQTTKLCKKTINKPLPICYLTIFSHYQEEYENLNKIMTKLGKKGNANNGSRFALNKPIKILDSQIANIRIREPDPYRMQVGCTDFSVVSYEVFKKKYLRKKLKLRLIERPEYEMIEFFDPNFDVLAYVVSK